MGPLFLQGVRISQVATVTSKSRYGMGRIGIADPAVTMKAAPDKRLFRPFHPDLFFDKDTGQ
jgi:hypothetical protein